MRALVLSIILLLIAGAAISADLDLRPIVRKPEPLTELHPKLQWMAKEKIRCTWISNDLFEKFESGDKTMGQVLRNAGFNSVAVSLVVNTDDKPSGAVDPTKPYNEKHDRSMSFDMDTRLAPNVKEARRLGLKLIIEWRYGTHHLEPYRKYRSPKGDEHKVTCCPLDVPYITGQHIGNWAEKIAKGGADGMILDMEMYHSDNSWPQGACVCDDCFATYLKEYAADWKSVYDKIAPESRGKWLEEQGATTHYADYSSKRMEAMYDSIRARCQKINPTFFFGVAPILYHFPGLGHRGAPVERGLGTSSVPTLIFSEHEYNHGPYRGSYMVMDWIPQEMPALFVCGAWVRRQSPAILAENMILSGLYCDGWWAWYGTALLTNTKAEQNLAMGDYGRYDNTSAQDYLSTIAATHKQIDRLLAGPKDKWPEKQDGKLKWLKARLATAEAEDARLKTETSAKALAEARADLEAYEASLRAGGS